jgi:hypothetical protein
MYSDRHSIFNGTKNDSQFCRALKELGIELILAHSPQAKGRVERSHATLQDRLIKLMRLEGISINGRWKQIFKEVYRGAQFPIFSTPQEF